MIPCCFKIWYGAYAKLGMGKEQIRVKDVKHEGSDEGEKKGERASFIN